MGTGDLIGFGFLGAFACGFGSVMGFAALDCYTSKVAQRCAIAWIVSTLGCAVVCFFSSIFRIVTIVVLG